LIFFLSQLYSSLTQLLSLFSSQLLSHHNILSSNHHHHQHDNTTTTTITVFSHQTWLSILSLNHHHHQLGCATVGTVVDFIALAATLDRARQRGSTATIAGKPNHRETWKRKTHRKRCSHHNGDPRREDLIHDDGEETHEGRR
jgi:hypothetical protein